MHTATARGSLPAAGVGIYPFFSGVSSPSPRAEVRPDTLLVWFLALWVRDPWCSPPPGKCLHKPASVQGLGTFRDRPRWLCVRAGGWPGPCDWHELTCLCLSPLPSRTWQMCLLSSVPTKDLPLPHFKGEETETRKWAEAASRTPRAHPSPLPCLI